MHAEATPHRARPDQAALPPDALSLRPAVALSRATTSRSLRPTFLDFPTIRAACEENDEMMLGPVAAGRAGGRAGRRRRASVYLPARRALVRLLDRRALRGRPDGRRVPAPLGPPGDVRARRQRHPAQHRRTAFRQAGLRTRAAPFPTDRRRRIRRRVFEDDGETAAYLGGQYRSGAAGGVRRHDIKITLTREGALAPTQKTLRLLLPLNETRTVTSSAITHRRKTLRRTPMHRRGCVTGSVSPLPLRERGNERDPSICANAGEGYFESARPLTYACARWRGSRLASLSRAERGNFALHEQPRTRASRATRRTRSPSGRFRRASSPRTLR